MARLYIYCITVIGLSIYLSFLIGIVDDSPFSSVISIFFFRYSIIYINDASISFSSSTSHYVADAP